MHRLKSSLLILSTLLILLLAPVVSADENVKLELVANTTSDLDGNYLLTDIPDGEYELYAVNKSYSNKYQEWRWYRTKMDITVNGTDLTGQDLVVSSSSTIDPRSILKYLNRSDISGRTYLYAMSTEYNKTSDVVLVDKITGEFVSNTTSDLDGNYLLTDIPDGEYELYAVNKSYSNKYQEWRWYRTMVDITVNGTDLTEQDLVVSSSSTIDPQSILKYLNRSDISGRTYLYAMSTEYNKTSDVVLVDKVTGEFVSNTTSDLDGNYLLTDVPDGDYELYAVNKSYSNKYQEWRWYRTMVDIIVNGTDLTGQDLVVSSSSTIDPQSILKYLNRSDISGRTYLYAMSTEYNKTSDVILLKKHMLTSTTVSNSPHVNISIVTGYKSHEIPLNSMLERINSNSTLNLTVSYYFPDDVQEGDVDLSDMDVIYVQMLSSSTALALMDTVDEAIANGAVVIDDDTALNENIPLSDSMKESYREIFDTYWSNGPYEETNLDNMVYMMASVFYDRNDLVVEDPVELPDTAVYHPAMSDYNHFCEDLNTYLNWYSNRTDGGHVYDENAPTVGITFYSSYYPFQIEPIDSLIDELESRNVNVIPTYGSDPGSSQVYFRQDNETVVDVIISFTYFSNKFDPEEVGVPVINGVINNYINRSEWESSSHPLPTNKMIKIDYPELVGSIDPIFIAATEINPETNAEERLSIDYQVEWLVDRTIAQADLAIKPESEKKVAIIYYNHGGGKDSIGASYLDVAPSLCRLLEAMETAGYDVNASQIPNETALIDRMLTQGINIGTWAPGELERLVSTGKVALFPAETYEQWFNELPQEKKEEVINRWGPAPGEIMVYEDETGKYLVIPRIDVGDNVMLAPQPTRGWLQDTDALYHDKDLPPHHQYIAFYLWLQNEYDADAIIHFGRHGTQEWLPGKQFGLSRYDWPSIMVGDMPVIYPYVMDGLGEGNQAKRRGNAVIIDHLVPPIVAAGSYGNYSELGEAILNYEMASQEPQKEIHKAEIINLTLQLHLDEQLDMGLVDNQTTFEEQFLEELDELLEGLKSSSMPYGLHILGTSPTDEKLVGMVNSMLGAGFAQEVYQFNDSEAAPLELLDLVLNQNTSITDAQIQVMNTTTQNVADYLNTSIAYAQALSESEYEVQQVLNALDGKFISANLGGDPVRNPYTLPTGKNFYAFDQRKVPTEAAWDLGKMMADQMLDAYRANNDGSYPNKAAYVLWAGETTRHEGVMEAQIFYLLGVEPVWDKGRVVDVEVIPSGELGRPRIDVMVQISGLYRDMFPDKVRLIDRAVQLAYEQNETPNYVRENTNALKQELMNSTALNESDALNLSLLRIFGSADGSYGTGLPNAVSASDTWENNDVLAELYISRMGNAYGQDIWGESATDVFRQNLAEVDVTMHSRSTNLYGALDNDDFFQYLGGLNLAVRYSSGGDDPESYVTNLLTNGDEKVETLDTYISRELYSRYFNPKWIEGMKEHGYAGAREMGDFIENLWGWEATNPDLIDDHMWDQTYQTYFNDPEMKEWLKQNNPYGYQAMTARMLETIRTDHWDASDEVVQSLVKEYVESVVEDGVTCCHHTCGNPTLDNYVEGVMSVAGVVPQETADLYRKMVDEATKRNEVPQEKTVRSSSSGGGTGSARIVESGSGNQTQAVDGGYGKDLEQTPTDAKNSDPDSNYVEGYEMTKESVENESGGMSFSGSDIVGSLLVLMALGAVYVGFIRKGL